MPLADRLASLPRWSWLAIFAILLMLPMIVGPVRLNDSHWINYVWTEQFSAAVARGELWPRWLPQSHGGLGAPVFYFYGPVAFWLAAPLGLIGLAPWSALLGAATLGLWLSGVAMARFLDRDAARPGLGAALYMALPYHLLDFDKRGAFAEFTAYVALPIVASAIRDRRPALLAAAYALLIMTHLPTALLASVTLLPVLAAMVIRHERAAIVPIASGLVLGLLLAAPYLLPALQLQRFVALDTMTAAPALQAVRWTIWSHDPQMRDGLVLIGLIAAALALPALALLRSDRWGWFVLVAVAMALGLVPAFWRIPLLARVQFPWRLLVIADFAAAWIVARSRWSLVRLLPWIVPLLTLSLVILRPTAAADGGLIAALLPRYPDVIEYLPGGTTEPYAAYSRRALDLAAGMPPIRTSDGWTTRRLDYFPIWQVRCADGIVPSEPEPGTGLLRYRGKPNGCTVERVRPASERIGWLLAVAAALAIIVRATRRRQLPSLLSLS